MYPFAQKGEPRNFKNVREVQNTHPHNKDIASCSYRPVNLVNPSLFWVYMISKIIHIVVTCFKTCPVFSTGFGSGVLQCHETEKPFYGKPKEYKMHILECIFYWKILIEKNIDKNKESSKANCKMFLFFQELLFEWSNLFCFVCFIWFTKIKFKVILSGLI